MDRSFLRLVAVVARRDYLRTVGRRGFLLGTLALPLAIGLIVAFSALVQGAAFSGVTAGRPTVIVVNESPLTLVPPAEGGELRQVALEEALAGLRDERWREFYRLPSGYPGTAQVERVVGGETGGFDAATLGRRVEQTQLLTETLRRSLAASEDVSQSTLDRLVEPIELAEVDPSGAPVADDSGAGAILLPTLFTLLFVMSIFITSNYLLQSVTEEKENRVVEILLSSVPALPLMAGKVIGLGAAGLTQVAIWLATAFAALAILPGLGIGGSTGTGTGLPSASGAVPLGPLEAPSPAVIAVALVYFLLGYLAYGALFAAIGALAPGTREAQQYSGFFGFVAIVPYIASGVFIADPGSVVAIALVLFPMTAPAAGLMALMLSPEPPWALVAASLGILAAFTALAVLVSSRIFRATLLLFGTRPSLRRVTDAIVGRA